MIRRKVGMFFFYMFETPYNWVYSSKSIALSVLKREIML